MKYLFSILIFISSVCYGQVPTTNYIPKTPYITNYIDGCNIGKTCYQIDKSNQTYYLSQNGYNYYVYYYYVWFYNHSIKNCDRSSTYIQSINVYIDNQYIGNYYLLITGDFYFLTLWSVNPRANIRLEYSQPLPY